MLFLLLLPLVNSLQIHLISSGSVTDTVVKSNLINAYRRYLKNSKQMLLLKVNGILQIGPISAGSEDHIVAAIKELKLGTRSDAICIDWYIDKLEPGMNAYIVTDMSPCNGTETIKNAHEFINNIVSIGMGPMIDSYWLRKTCTCGRFGCLSGLDWFRID